MQNSRPDGIENRKTLESFLVLPENRFSHHVLESWSEDTADHTTSFVFVYGPSGTGKSFLVQSLTKQLQEFHPDWRIKTTSAVDFLAQFSDAAESNSFAKFRKQFQRLHVLAFEDLQGLSNREDAQRQLKLILDDAIAHDCRVVITCRTSVAEAGTFIPELIDRCHGAVTIPIRLPSLSSRQRLIQHWTREFDPGWDPEISEFLATQFAVTPRELYGLVTQLKSLSEMKKQTLGLDAVRKHVLGHHPQRKMVAGEIAKCVARHFQITLAALRSESRQPKVVLPRQCAIFLIRELTDWSLKKIGEYFGGRDHSTILHACQKMSSLIPDRPEVRHHLHKIRAQLNVSQS